MAVGSNDSNKQVVGALWTGIAAMKVVAINPTMDEMKAMGMNPQKEPEYKSTNDAGKTKLRIDFYLANTINKIRAKASIWMEAQERKSQGGASQFINAKGQVAFPKKGETSISYDWFSQEGIRPAYIGEETLISFIKAWANVDSASNCSFDTIAKIVEGDLTEIVALWKTIPNNEVRVLLGVKDGKYQDVYTKYFARFTQVSFEGWKNTLEGQYGEFKNADYQDDLHLKPYQGTGIVPTDKPSSLPPVVTGATGGYKF